MTINETLADPMPFNSQRSAERNNWVDRVRDGGAINVYLCPCETPENTPSSRGNGLSPGVEPARGNAIFQ